MVPPPHLMTFICSLFKVTKTSRRQLGPEHFVLASFHALFSKKNLLCLFDVTLEDP